MSQLLFTPPSSAFEPTFWESLYHKKLNVYRLDSTPVPIHAELLPADSREHGCMRFSGDSFDGTPNFQPVVNGRLINLNKIEEFQVYDKKQLIIQEGQRILGSMAKGDAIRNPSLLNQFALLSFADLKSYKFVFWFANPALSLKDGISVQIPFSSLRGNGVSESTESDEFLRCAYTFMEACTKNGEEIPLVFAIRDKSVHLDTISEDPSTRPIPEFGFSEDEVVTDEKSENNAPTSHKESNNDRWEAMTLFDAWAYRYDSSAIRFVILDQSNQEQALGWTARNFLSMLALYGTQDRSSYFLSSLFFTEWHQRLLENEEAAAMGSSGFPPLPPPNSSKNYVQLVGLRNPQLRKLNNLGSGNWNIDHLISHDVSVIGKVAIPVLTLPEHFDVSGRIDVPLLANSLFPTDGSTMHIVGWEPNERGKAGPRIADLKATLDTRVLMSQAVDLNLRLMKWRQWPALQVDTLRHQKCLLLGSGTLGCAVARALMGWGIRHITLVDNGRVAYSNPVRQSLFTYEDAQKGKFKAVAAAEQLVKIFPDMTATSELLSIPMPGHPFRIQNATANSAETSATTSEVLTDDAARSRLDTLVQSHDVVFNLTDSREARWLPTLLATLYQKPCINAALGFDSYLVSQRDNSPGSDHCGGCYFCSDIVAAGNSQRDRTLDEQCTVTRPGLSFIAGALCAELLVALLHKRKSQPKKSQSNDSAGAKEGLEEVNKNDDEEAEITDIHYDDDHAGSVPQQIRGSVLGFTQMCLESSSFPLCTACSPAITNAYRESPSEFVAQVSQDPTYLETLSGITAMVQDVDVQLCIDSDEEF